jgi:hemoglobin/transferrin/lactoferrin receptor protein
MWQPDESRDYRYPGAMTRSPGFLSMPAVIVAAGFFFGSQNGAEAAERGLTRDAEEPVEQLVVVAHKDERSIREIAANVTVLSRADLTTQMATSLGDIFRYVPGIDHEGAGNRFGTEGINIRGIGGNRVAIVVDGVPLTEHFDIGSFSNATRDFIDAGLVQNIEVLHGPASALYGSSAIGGVVAARTPDPFDIAGNEGSGGDVLVTWRDADSSRHAQGLFALGNNSPGNGSLGVVFGGSWRDGEQVDPAGVDSSLDTRDYERRTATAKFVADDPFGNTFRAGIIHQASDTQSDLSSLLGTGRYRSTTALEGDDSYELDLFNISYEFGSPEGVIDNGVLRAFYEVGDIEQITLDERAAATTPVSIDRYFAFEQVVRGIEMNLWKNFATGSVSHRLGFGLEYRDRETEEYRDGLSTNLETGAQTNVLLGEVFPLRDFPISTAEEMAVYVEDTMSVGDWTIIAALRADQYELSPQQDSMYLEDYPFAELVSISESDVSPKLGAIYAVTQDVDVYLQYSHGFRAPPFEDANIGLEIPVFNFRAIPNPDLRSESSDGFELGLRWQGLSSSAYLSVFHTRYEDFIESKVRLGIDPVSGRLLFQSQNLDETRIEGIEAGGALRFDGALSAFGMDASAFYASGENKENGEPLNSVGPPQAVVGISWFSPSERSQLRLKTTLTDGWDERDETSGELFKPPGHAVFDLFYTQQLGERITLRAGLHNLTDRTYWNWSDVRGLSPDDPLLPYLAQAGRNASISMNINW